MKNKVNRYLKRNTDRTEIDVDFIKGRKFTNNESLSMIFQDICFNPEEFAEAIKKYVKWK